MWTLVSGKKKNAKRRFTPVRAEAAKPSAENPYMLRSPPIAGPIINPAPWAAPTLPIPFALSFSVVMSEMYAWAKADSVAIPAVIRERRSKRNELAKAKIMKLNKEDNIDIIITGRLPILSDRRPRSGANMNCIKENEPIRSPRAKAPAPAVSGWKGKIGMIIPYPIMSMNVVITTTEEGEIPSLRCMLSFWSTFLPM